MTAQPPSFEPASLLRRLAAFSYDLLLLAALILSFTLLVVAVRLGEPVPPGSVWFPLCVAALIAAFFCAFWVHGGQTLGMRAWRIRVVRDDGGRLTWRSAAARFAGALVAVLPAGLGLWWSLLDDAGRAWHDRWTRTRVVRTNAAGFPSERA
ncbi:MAG TPA: RDD family protein [Gammaproteobacteria bacterium]|nr:RDD family protein [Gammaproteobacteria bacterium]